MSKYIHNKSTANVSLINGKILVKIGQKQEVTDQEAEHEDVIHARRMGWITIEGPKSNSVAPNAPGAIEFAKDELKGSSTIPKVEKKIGAVSTAIGQDSVEAETKPKKQKKPE